MKTDDSKSDYENYAGCAFYHENQFFFFFFFNAIECKKGCTSKDVAPMDLERPLHYRREGKVV